jgi:hypothetical protein
MGYRIIPTHFSYKIAEFLFVCLINYKQTIILWILRAGEVSMGNCIMKSLNQCRPCSIKYVEVDRFPTFVNNIIALLFVNSAQLEVDTKIFHIHAGKLPHLERIRCQFDQGKTAGSWP